MIYLRSNGGKHLIIAGPDNFERMQQGDAMVTPDHSVMVAYTPDPDWLAREIVERSLCPEGALDSEGLDALLKEAMARPPVKAGPYHPPVNLIGRSKP